MLLEIKELNKSFGNLKVLNNINLEFTESGIYVLIGPNGSGKTTLLKSLLGIIHPDSGSIKVEDKDITDYKNFKNKFSYLPQIAQFPENLTGNDLIKMMKDFRDGATKEEKYIEIFNVKSELNKPIKNLSGGNKQKINTILSLMFDTDLYIFDEPTVGLDPVSVIKFREILIDLKKENKLILLTSHNLDFVNLVSDNIIFLLFGKIYFRGKYNELLKNENSETLIEAIAKILEGNEIVKDN